MKMLVSWQNCLYRLWPCRPLCMLLLLLTVDGMVQVNGWNPSNTPTDTPNNPVSRTAFLSKVAATATTSLLLLVSPTGDLSRDAAYAAAPERGGGTDDDDFVQSITRSLSPPTDERPPIAFAYPEKLRNSNNSKNPQPMTPSLPPPQRVEALITLENPQQRPSPSDVLVIQVYESPNCRQLLGGARVPVSRIRFPIQVQLTSANAKLSSTTNSGVEVWNSLTSSQDLWMVASICLGVHEDGDRTMCLDSHDSTHVIYQATGISKFLTRIPGLATPNDTLLETMGQKGIRLPATLALKRL